MAPLLHHSAHMETQQGAMPKLEPWEIDPLGSSLTFNLRHLVVQQIRGRFERWGGRIFVDTHQPWLSTVEIWIDLRSVTTGDTERDAHVRSPEFFDVAQFSRAEFKSTNVAVRESKVILDGRLTLHGVTRDVEIQAEIGAMTTDPDGRGRARYSGRAVIDRQSFGLHWNQDLDVGGVVVGDEVEILAEMELLHAAATAG
ncbi:MAG TPA: YceI family protein [Polyangia bacterium]|nr:YceI family protein [Polyangia bacterium]